MEFQQVVRRRRMVRNFDDRPLPPATVDAILENARRGPSAGFTQGVELLVLEGPEQTARYWDASGPLGGDFRWPGLRRAPLLIVLFAHEQAYLDRYAEPDKRGDGTGNWSAPYWIVDTAFAALLALLTAVDRDLGALFFGVFHADEVRAAFGVPEEFQPVGVIAAGYPLPDEASASLRRGRRPAVDVIHRGRW
ncbi:MAG: nitroreductase family protein [Acidimicrobiales bacterium]